VHSVSQRPNLWHLGEPLGELAEGLMEAVSFKKRRRRKVWVEEESRMPDGSEFYTAGAAALKPREAKVVRTRGTDNKLVFAERIENVWECEH